LTAWLGPRGCWIPLPGRHLGFLPALLSCPSRRRAWGSTGAARRRPRAVSLPTVPARPLPPRAPPSLSASGDERAPFNGKLYPGFPAVGLTWGGFPFFLCVGADLGERKAFQVGGGGMGKPSCCGGPEAENGEEVLSDPEPSRGMCWLDGRCESPPSAHVTSWCVPSLGADTRTQPRPPRHSTPPTGQSSRARSSRCFGQTGAIPQRTAVCFSPLIGDF